MKIKHPIDPGMERDIPDAMVRGAIPAPAPVRWQYTSLKLPHLSDAALSKLGAEGWELVSTSSCREDPSQTVFHLKRQVNS